MGGSSLGKVSLKDEGGGKDWGGFTRVCAPEDVPQPLPAAVQGAASLSLSLNSSLHHLRLLHSFLSVKWREAGPGGVGLLSYTTSSRLRLGSRMAQDSCFSSAFHFLILDSPT